MKAVRYHEYGDSSVMHVEEIERPHPGPGQVLVRVVATAFNPLDATMRAGYLQGAFPIRLPHTPGFDVAGTVAELGEGVPSFAVGDAVIGFLPMTDDGAAAEFVLAPADVLTAAPASIPLADAAALPSSSLTAWQALFKHADLEAGQRILINGAGGGVGGYAIQLAKRAGATVIATASPRSADAVTADGADQVIDYTNTRLIDAVTEPVDAVLNLVRVPDDEMATLIGLIRPGGVIVSTAATAKDDPARNVRAVDMFVRSDVAQLAAIVAKVDACDLRVDISERHPLSEIAEVQDRGMAGDLRGKVLLIPGL